MGGVGGFAGGGCSRAHARPQGAHKRRPYAGRLVGWGAARDGRTRGGRMGARIPTAGQVVAAPVALVTVFVGASLVGALGMDGRRRSM